MEQSYERSLYEARLDAECYAVSHELHARLWRRFRTLTRLLVGFTATGAVAGWLATRPDIAGMSALGIAFLAALDQAIDPSDKIARHRLMAQRYIELKRKAIAVEMAVAEFDSALEAIKAEDEAGLDALLVRAFNRVVVSAGRPDFRLPESIWQRFVAFFA
jgi:hypothetical protein